MQKENGRNDRNETKECRGDQHFKTGERVVEKKVGGGDARVSTYQGKGLPGAN